MIPLTLLGLPFLWCYVGDRQHVRGESQQDGGSSLSPLS